MVSAIKVNDGRMYEYHCQITRIIDGDTVQAVIDLGFNVSIAQTIRLADIDAPERGEKNYKKAADRLDELIDIYAENRRLLLQTQGRGKYGRWIGTLYDSQGVSLNKLMQESGCLKNE
jgi:micrococcal nuclease